MSLERLIQRPVKTLPPDAPCAEAARVMRDENVGCVVVTEDGRPLGVVTDRDLVVRVIADDRDADKLLLRDVMTGEPIFVTGSGGVGQVLAAMRDLAIRRVPIVDEHGRLSGIVAMDDVLLLLAEQLGDVAEAIRAEIGADED
jgi:CBS domain-containing protein